MTILRPPAIAALLLLSGQAAAETCPPAAGQARREARAPTSCAPPARKVEPYDPDRVRAGTRPGFIDLGGGTEVRIGGRARMDYDARR